MSKSLVSMTQVHDMIGLYPIIMVRRRFVHDFFWGLCCQTPTNLAGPSVRSWCLDGSTILNDLYKQKKNGIRYNFIPFKNRPCPYKRPAPHIILWNCEQWSIIIYPYSLAKRVQTYIGFCWLIQYSSDPCKSVWPCVARWYHNRDMPKFGSKSESWHAQIWEYISSHHGAIIIAPCSHAKIA